MVSTLTALLQEAELFAAVEMGMSEIHSVSVDWSHALQTLVEQMPNAHQPEGQLSASADLATPEIRTPTAFSTRARAALAARRLSVRTTAERPSASVPQDMLAIHMFLADKTLVPAVMPVVLMPNVPTAADVPFANADAATLVAHTADQVVVPTLVSQASAELVPSVKM